MDTRLDHRKVVLAEALEAFEGAFAVVGFGIVDAGFNFWAEIFGLAGAQLGDEIINLKQETTSFLASAIFYTFWDQKCRNNFIVEPELLRLGEKKSNINLALVLWVIQNSSQLQCFAKLLSILTQPPLIPSYALNLH